MTQMVMSWSSSLTRHEALGVGLAVWDSHIGLPDWCTASQATESAELQFCALARFDHGRVLGFVEANLAAARKSDLRD
jgi:hypothetical protein